MDLTDWTQQQKKKSSELIDNSIKIIQIQLKERKRWFKKIDNLSSLGQLQSWSNIVHVIRDPEGEQREWDIGKI